MGRKPNDQKNGVAQSATQKAAGDLKELTRYVKKLRSARDIVADLEAQKIPLSVTAINEKIASTIKIGQQLAAKLFDEQ